MSKEPGTNRGDDHVATVRAQRGYSRGMRLMLAIASASLVLALLSTSLSKPRPLLVWNASPSSTMGLYRVRARGSMRKGDMIIAFAPNWARRLAAQRGYLPYGVPLVKQLVAVGGDRVCARGAEVFVDGALAARRFARDPHGRTLPGWQGCRTLSGDQAFLLSPGVPRAFDGRYFGVTSKRDIVGSAQLLWTRDTQPRSR